MKLDRLGRSANRHGWSYSLFLPGSERPFGPGFRRLFQARHEAHEIIRKRPLESIMVRRSDGKLLGTYHGWQARKLMGWAS